MVAGRPPLISEGLPGTYWEIINNQADTNVSLEGCLSVRFLSVKFLSGRVPAWKGGR